MNRAIENVVVRPATLSDLRDLKAFMQQLVDAERPFNSTLKEGEIVYYDIEELIADQKTVLMVADCDGRLIGCGYAQIRTAKEYVKHQSYGYLGFMFVDPEFRGKGIGALLLANLKKWILSQGVTEVRLDVYDENEAAVRAYHKAGFKKLISTMRCDIS